MNRTQSDISGDAPSATSVGNGNTVLPVSLFVARARLLIERNLGVAWIGGEVSNFTRAASGHCYFNLKDAQAQLRCVLFRQRAQHVDFALRDGLAVEVRAGATIYEARGEFQLNVDSVRLAGIGALYEQFALLKARLAAAGWFAPERKRALPEFPRVIGIVTSPRAAALRDILTTLGRRWPAAQVILYPTAVQGAGAAAELALAIRTANKRADADVLIVARGGGSIEDLWAFNEEVVAKAVFESTLPVISGVGHETDFTICDFVADARAPTPTAAAALATPDREALVGRVGNGAQRLARAGAHAVDTRIQRLDHVVKRLVHPAARLDQQQLRLGELQRRLALGWRRGTAAQLARADAAGARLLRELRAPLPPAIRAERLRAALRTAGRNALARGAERSAALAQGLRHLDPRAVLDRGYSIVATAAGAIVTDAGVLNSGDPLALTFARGSAQAQVTRTLGVEPPAPEAAADERQQRSEPDQGQR